MTRSEARNEIVNNPGKYLTPARKTGYVCPICKSGSGTKKTGMTTKDGIHFTCWAGADCTPVNADGNKVPIDIIDIIGKVEGLKDYNAKLRRACEIYGIDYNQLEPDNNQRINDGWKEHKKTMEKKNQEENKEPIKEKTDYMDFFEQCCKRSGESDYLQKRGISPELQASFHIGFCPDWQSPAALRNGRKAPKTDRIIIPTGKHSYVARATDAAVEARYMKEGKPGYFNIRGLRKYGQEKPFFVVEGEIDALSIEQCGYKAVALGSTGQCASFAAYLDTQNIKPRYPLMIALDNDEPGQKAAEGLRQQLEGVGIKSENLGNIYGTFKDANEALTSGAKEKLVEELRRAVEKAETEANAEKVKYMQNSAAFSLMGLLEAARSGHGQTYTPTGMSEFDRVMDGGIYEEFIILGAMPSIGKTTYAMQIADALAKRGRDVLIFSLEMSRAELIAKSISRNTAEIVLEDGGNIATLARTGRDITVSSRWAAYTDQQKNIIDQAAENYQDYARHIFISEGIGDIGVKQIRETIEQHIKIMKQKPVVFIDYLQCLAPESESKSDKQNTDSSITELKRLSRDCHIPIIAISSYNRTNYESGANMAAFKESGSIEYGADVLLGLQYKGVEEESFDLERAKQQTPRSVELVVLKNRNATTGGRVNLEYYPKYNLFTESKAAPTAKTWKKTKREREQEEIDFAFLATCETIGGTEKSTLERIAEYMDKRTTAVKSILREYGYMIEKETGVVTRAEEKADPLETVPFEEKPE